MKQKEKLFEFFDVTADIGFYAYGDNLAQTYENAGLAMFNIISNTENISTVKKFEFSIKSEDKVSLLYDFLEELLFLHEVEFVLLSDFKVDISKIANGYQLNAVVMGDEINWDKYLRGSEVKAITFHKMDVYKKDDEYVAQAILDL